MPNYSGISSNSNTNVSSSEKFPRRKTLKNRIFGRSNAKVLQQNNRKVPKLNLTARKGLNTNGYVSPQTANNSIVNVRNFTYEQNFLWRMISMVDTSINNRPEVNIKPLNLSEYEKQLESETITEEEAIQLYNELIALLVIMMVYIALILEGNKGIKTEKDLKSIFNKDTILRRIIVNSPRDNPGLLTFLGSVSGAAAGVGIVYGGIFLISATHGAAVLLLLPIVAITVGTVISFEKFKSRETILKNREISIYEFINIILRTINSPTNMIPIRNVRDKLKYWGLNTSQVDLFYNSSENLNIVKLFELSNNHSPLAPNEPLVRPANSPKAIQMPNTTEEPILLPNTNYKMTNLRNATPVGGKRTRYSKRH